MSGPQSVELMVGFPLMVAFRRISPNSTNYRTLLFGISRPDMKSSRIKPPSGPAAIIRRAYCDIRLVPHAIALQRRGTCALSFRLNCRQGCKICPEVADENPRAAAPFDSAQTSVSNILIQR
jgi:hypothetical protein